MNPASPQARSTVRVLRMPAGIMLSEGAPLQDRSARIAVDAERPTVSTAQIADDRIADEGLQAWRDLLPGVTSVRLHDDRRSLYVDPPAPFAPHNRMGRGPVAWDPDWDLLIQRPHNRPVMVSGESPLRTDHGRGAIPPEQDFRSALEAGATDVPAEMSIPLQRLLTYVSYEQGVFVPGLQEQDTTSLAQRVREALERRARLGDPDPLGGTLTRMQEDVQARADAEKAAADAARAAAADRAAKGLSLERGKGPTRPWQPGPGRGLRPDPRRSAGTSTPRTRSSRFSAIP